VARPGEFDMTGAGDPLGEPHGDVPEVREVVVAGDEQGGCVMAATSVSTRMGGNSATAALLYGRSGTGVWPKPRRSQRTTR
jgi:hypothetical protein